MAAGKDDDDNKKCCPVSETVRHVLYIGGMIALHTGIGASVSVSNKSHQCPVSEWGRHAVYVGAAVALAAKAGMGTHTKAIEDSKPKDDEEKKWYADEWAKHALYVAGMVGVVAMINARKK